MTCDRRATSYMDRNSAQPIDHGETVLVGSVVAGEHRQPAVEWRLSEKIRDHTTLAG